MAPLRGILFVVIQLLSWTSSAPTPDPIPFYFYENLTGFTQCRHYSASPKLAMGVLSALEAMRHPWRVHNPAKAKVFFVPILLDQMVRHQCNGTMLEHLQDMMLHVRRHWSWGVHFLITSDWKSDRYVTWFWKAMPDLVVGTKMPFQNNPCTFTVGFSTLWSARKKRAPPLDYKRTNRIEFIGQVDRRAGYKDRWHLFHTEERFPKEHSIIVTNTPSQKSRLPQCSENTFWYCTTAGIPGALGLRGTMQIRLRTNYSIFLRGDDEGGDRMINAIASGQTVIAVARGSATAWLPFQTKIPWDRLVYTVPQSAFRQDAVQSIETAIASAPSPDVTTALALQHRADFDYGVRNNRVLANILDSVYHHPCAQRKSNHSVPLEDWDVLSTSLPSKHWKEHSEPS